MADTAAQPAAGVNSSGSSDDTPHNHLGTNVPTGSLDHDPEKTPHDEKETHGGIEQKKEAEGTPIDDDEDEDIDALIDDLESQDGHAEEEEEETQAPGSAARPVPEELLQTDTRHGLTSDEVDRRRKKFGLNQMKATKIILDTQCVIQLANNLIVHAKIKFVKLDVH